MAFPAFKDVVPTILMCDAHSVAMHPDHVKLGAQVDLLASQPETDFHIFVWGGGG